MTSAGTTVPELRYSVDVAAQRLGITERAVRKRIQAGTLYGELVDRKWWVFLPAEPGTGTSPGTGADTAGASAEPRPSAGTGPEPRPEQGRNPDAGMVALRTAIEERYLDTITRMQDDHERQVADLKAAHGETVATKDALIDELRARAERAESRVGALEAVNAESSTTTEDAPPGRPERAWWQFWKAD